MAEIEKFVPHRGPCEFFRDGARRDNKTLSHFDLCCMDDSFQVIRARWTRISIYHHQYSGNSPVDSSQMNLAPESFIFGNRFHQAVLMTRTHKEPIICFGVWNCSSKHIGNFRVRPIPDRQEWPGKMTTRQSSKSWQKPSDFWWILGYLFKPQQFKVT